MRIKKRRFRDPRDNPTEVIHRLIEEYKVVVNEYLLLRNYILQNPDVRAVDIPVPSIEYHELDQQIGRRKALNISRSRAKRTSVELSRLRTEEGSYLRVHNKPILQAVDELMKQPERFELVDEAKRELERPLTDEEERQLALNTSRDTVTKQVGGRARFTSDGKEIKYDDKSGYDPKTDAPPLGTNLKNLLDD
jgi:hypothetical protein